MRRLAIILLLMAAACSTQQRAQPTQARPTATAIVGGQTAAAAMPSAAPSATAATSSALAPPATTPTPTPPAATLRQLTSGGCCTQPFWSPDSMRVLFIDRSEPGSTVGIYGVDVGGGGAELVTDRLGLYSDDFSLRAFLQNGQTVVESFNTGDQWVIQSGGRTVSFSPDDLQVAWTAGNPGPPFDTAARDVWVSRVDGSQPQRLLTLYGGGFSGWLPDGRMLVSGRQALEDTDQVLSIYDPADGSLKELARAFRLRSTSLSPGGTWLAYVSAFDEDPEQNGLWVLNIDSGERRKLEIFGAFRWRDDDRLLVIPLDVTTNEHVFYQVEAATGAVERLAEPMMEGVDAPNRLHIANNDWSVSPDGKWVALISAEDHNIWLLQLP